MPYSHRRFGIERLKSVLPRCYPERIGFERDKPKCLQNMARPRRFERPTVAFGGQRSNQLDYGRLWASIDQTTASGNALDIAGYCSIGLCVKAPSAKVGRSNRLGRASRSRAEGVAGVKRSISDLAKLPFGRSDCRRCKRSLDLGIDRTRP